MSFFKPWTLTKHLGASVLIAILAYYINRYFSPRNQAMSIGIIGGADGPTAIFITGKLLSQNILVYLGVFILLLVLYFPLSRWIKP